jgi:hypothetical protein
LFNLPHHVKTLADAGIGVEAQMGDFSFNNNPLTSVTIGSNVNIGSTAFDGNFNDVYEANGKAAGTYTFEGENWKKQ